MKRSIVMLAALLELGTQGMGLAQPNSAGTEVVRVVQVWLECEECREGQRAAVVRLGAAAVPVLGQYLRGPAPERRAEVQRSLQAAWQKMKEYEADHANVKVPMTQDEYVTTYLDNFIALYQVRSAIGLGDIGGSEAARLLNEARRQPLREDVKTVVEQQAERVKKK